MLGIEIEFYTWGALVKQKLFSVCLNGNMGNGWVIGQHTQKLMGSKIIWITGGLIVS